MTFNIDNYDGVSTAMNIFLIYNIAFQLVIVVLAEEIHFQNNENAKNNVSFEM